MLFPYFQKHGLKGITRDLVAKQLQRGKTTVYDYFQSKEELVAKIVAYKLDQIQGFENILRDDQASFSSQCCQVLKHLADHISDISSIFLADLRKLYPNSWKKIEGF